MVRTLPQLSEQSFQLTNCFSRCPGFFWFLSTASAALQDDEPGTEHSKNVTIVTWQSIIIRNLCFFQHYLKRF